MGLKFGIHIMMGTSKYAVNKTVKGTNYKVKDIVGNNHCPWPGVHFGDKFQSHVNLQHRKKNKSANQYHVGISNNTNHGCGCNWESRSLDVNMSHPGARPYYTSLIEQYIHEWRVDFIKNVRVWNLLQTLDRARTGFDLMRIS
jgi:hypothetical protein